MRQKHFREKKQKKQLVCVHRMLVKVHLCTVSSTAKCAHFTDEWSLIERLNMHSCKSHSHSMGQNPSTAPLVVRCVRKLVDILCNETNKPLRRELRHICLWLWSAMITFTWQTFDYCSMVFIRLKTIMDHYLILTFKHLAFK